MSESMEGVEPIAIVGMAGRFPGAPNIERFWRNLIEGVESIRRLTDEELRAAGVPQSSIDDPKYVKAFGVLDGIEDFDAAFFGFTPREAESMDPQHRLLLECAWETLEHAGYNPFEYQGAIGVFTGVGISTYLLRNLATNMDLIQAVGPFEVSIANDKDYAPTRISYKLNLRGPSIQLSTACSSGLVAVHAACQSLWSFECDMALAGGVTIAVPQTEGYLYREGGNMSPDGHCRAFDASAAGMVGGNGLGLVLLKRLKDAISDRDTIHAVIRSTAVNNDGNDKIGYTAPSVDGQAKAIAEAIELSGVNPRTITYLEAHGTGTSLGDPIEIEALRKAYRAYTDDNAYCAIGSVKTNIGHLDRAAGIAGLIKVVQALKHRQLPPTINYVRPNPKIDFPNTPFVVNDTLRLWQSGNAPLRAAISSFGIGGTNAHAILEEAPESVPTSSGRPLQLLTISARTPDALKAQATALATYISSVDSLRLEDIAYTLSAGRVPMSCRTSMVIEDNVSAKLALEQVAKTWETQNTKGSKERSLCLMFPGQGAQYPHMTRGLYEQEKLFRDTIEHGCAILRERYELDLLPLLYPSETDLASAQEKLKATAITQPVLFLVEYALAKLLTSWGLEPSASIGHSIGEYVAACLAGVFTFEDALAVVAERGRLLQRLPEGAMLSVEMSEQEARSYLSESVALAAVNGTRLCVLSGPTPEIERLEQQLNAQKRFVRRLHTSHAFHSVMVEPCLEAFKAFLQKIPLQPPRIPYLSNVTGKFIEPSEATDPAYYLKHLRGTVRFADGIRVLTQAGKWVFLECGPGNTLTTFVSQLIDSAGTHAVLPTVRHPKDPRSDHRMLLEAVGKFWEHGGTIDWASFYAGQERRRVPLPTYPFERKRYWVEPRSLEELLSVPGLIPSATSQARKQQNTVDKEPNVERWFYAPSWIRRPIERQSTAYAPTKYLFFTADTPLCRQLASKLTERGDTVITVHRNSRFDLSGDRSFIMNPEDPEHYIKLFERLDKTDRLPGMIIHGWMLHEEDSSHDYEQRFASTQRHGCYSLLHLIQALNKVSGMRPAALYCLTEGCFDILGNETLRPELSTHLGISVSITQEHPNLLMTTIDLDTHDQQTAKYVLDELSIAPDSDQHVPAVAIRTEQRWIKSYTPVSVAQPKGIPDRLRKNGVYLITGGLGEIGLTLAEYLAREVQAKLILIGRSPIPPTDAWEELVKTNSSADPLVKKVLRLKQLLALGSEVMAISGDVSDLRRMTEIAEQAEQRFGHIHGVFHAAGLLSDRGFSPLAKITPELFEKHFDPKVRGLYVLQRISEDRSLDFISLLSSISTVLGGLGYSAYASGNAFMDAFAAAMNRKSQTHWQNVNWDSWRFSEPEIAPPAMAGMLKLALDPTEGQACFARLLHKHTDRHLVVSTGNLHERLLRAQARLNLAVIETDASNGIKLKRHPRPAQLPTPFVAPRNEMETYVCEVWQDLFGIESIGVDDNFFELGGHSLLGTQLLTRLRTQLGIDIPLHSIFEEPTVAGIVKVIDSLCGELDELEASSSDTRDIEIVEV